MSINVFISVPRWNTTHLSNDDTPKEDTMKALLMTFALMMAGPTFADEDTAINTLAGMADEMNDYMEFYYIFFTDIDDEGVVDYSSRCAYGENFKRINR